MLTTDTMERQTGQMTIEDMEPDTVEEMLNFICTGTVKDPVLDGKAMDLFVAADRLVTISQVLLYFVTMSNFVSINGTPGTT